MLNETYVDDYSDFGTIVYIHDKPVIDIGKIGAFDDCGANVCSVIRYILFIIILVESVQLYYKKIYTGLRI
jgi:hypothetical protein